MDRNVWKENFRRPAYFDLIREVRSESSECEIDNAVQNERVHFNSVTGHVSGSFVVSDRWSCFQMGTGHPPGLVRGAYRLSVGCHACSVGVFRRTAANAALPFTGSPLRGPLLWFGGSAIAIGALLVAVARRRRVEAASRSVAWRRHQPVLGGP
jgi:hypothetical protein